MKTLILALGLISILGTSAYADYHSVLSGIRLHLSTTTIGGRGTAIAVMDANGVTTVSRSTRTMTLPATVLEGYISRLNVDPPVTISSATPPDELVKDWISFLERDELVRLKHPRPGLARTKHVRGLLIPVSIIAKVESLPGPFDGDAGMGEPFFVLPWQAELMSARAPNYSCSPPTERHEVEWISYNPNVGENEFASLCGSPTADSSGAAPLVKKGNVFAVYYPAD